MALSPAWLGGARRARLFVSGVEHRSVLKGGRFAPEDVERLPVSADGVLDIEASAARLERWRETNDAPFMASLMLANNETGAIQPVAALAPLVHALRGLLHCDCVQAAGKISLEAATDNADVMTISAHKFGGPKGAGALVLCNERLGFAQPLISGGGQERGFRAGTENVAAISGFGVAAGIARREALAPGEIAALRGRIEAEILRIAPDAVIFAGKGPRLSNTVCFAYPGMFAETVLMAFDLESVSLSAGSACSSGKVEHSHVLGAMGVAPDLAGAAIRVSAGWNTTGADVERFSAAWQRIYSKFQERRRAA